MTSTKPTPIPASYCRVTPAQVANGGVKALEWFIVDPFGPGWTVATHSEGMVPDEMLRRRMAAVRTKGGDQ